MPKTRAEKGTGNELLRQYLARHKIPIAHTAEELYRHSVVDDDGEEIDELRRMLDEWRHNDREYRRRID